MGSVKTDVNDALTSIENTVRNFRLPALKTRIEIDTGALSGLGVGNNFGIRAEAYAGGGFPNTGDLFYANEDGPELIGRMGNQTAVANPRPNHWRYCISGRKCHD